MYNKKTKEYAPFHQSFHPLPIQLIITENISIQITDRHKHINTEIITNSLHLLCFIVITFFRTTCCMRNKPRRIMIKTKKVQRV